MHNITAPHKVDLALLPTPIYYLERFSRKLGVNIFVKRDDMTGVELSGNKIRKLEYHLADAIEQGKDAVITFGGIQSNHCRATVYAARRLGLMPILIHSGQEPEMAEGNYFLNKLAKAKTFFAPDVDFFNPKSAIKEAGQWAVHKGLKTAVIPLGASDAMGLWGYIGCAREIKDYTNEKRTVFNKVICTVGSGGTYGGLLAGSKLYGLDSEIIGFNVLETAELVKELVSKQLFDFKEKFSVQLGVKDDINIIDGYVGTGYGKTWPELIALIEEVAVEEGIVLDPVYTGKAFYALVDQIKKGLFREGDNVLFLHTGGIYGVFPHRRQFIMK